MDRSRKAEQIVEDQVRLWDHMAMEGKRHRGEPAHWPVITISREFCTPGDVLTVELNRHTGFTVWDKELLHEIAREIHGEERLLQTLDEHRRRAIDDAIRGALVRSAPTNYQYLHGLMRVVRTLSAHGRAIIVGRGAHYILDTGAALRVRLIAPVDHRVREHAIAQGVSISDARRMVSQADADQADFIRYHYHHDITHTSCYDLVLNAATFPVCEMTALVLKAYLAKFGYLPKAVEQVSSVSN